MRNSISVLFLVFFVFPACAYAALININTADATLLDTLPGIGPTYATRIVEYRTAHGPFARIEDIQNVSGIGPSTYAGLAPLITVGDTGTSDTSATSTNGTASSTAADVPPATTGSATYTPPPAALTLDVGENQNAVVEVPLHLTARVTTKNGVVDPSARIVWGFGDGSSTEGTTIEKVYRYAGTYLITVTAVDGPTAVRGELVVTVRPAQARIQGISGTGITIANDANERLDLSGWILSADIGSFRIPNGTVLLPKANVLFPSTITDLFTTPDATLAYPDGIIAARYVPPAPVPADVVQPLSPAARYESVQAVEPITSTKQNIQAHDEAVGAPAAPTQSVGAAGAVLSASPAKPSTGVLHSPWTLGLLGIMALAGGAFILL